MNCWCKRSAKVALSFSFAGTLDSFLEPFLDSLWWSKAPNKNYQSEILHRPKPPKDVMGDFRQIYFKGVTKEAMHPTELRNNVTQDARDRPQ